MLILKNNNYILLWNSYFCFYFTFTSGGNLVFRFHVIAVKVTMSACEHEVKLNYICLILS